MEKQNLNESFICRIWEDPVYYNNLHTLNSEKVSIIEYGKLNFDAGADYKNAKIKIDDKIYEGDIEIHRGLNDWNLHKHRKDKNYNRVILNVCLWGGNSGKKINSKNRKNIPTVILSEFLTKPISQIYKEITETPGNNFKLPCYPDNLDIGTEFKKEWINKLADERLKYKLDRFRYKITTYGLNINKSLVWEKVLFDYLAEALGYSKNKNQFLKLANNLEISLFNNKELSLIDTDAILFGKGGFLTNNTVKDEYTKKLIAKWNLFTLKKGGEILDKTEWMFFRLRTMNFPTLRLAYLSGIFYQIIQEGLFKKFVMLFETGNKLKLNIEKIFKDIKISNYWIMYYNFGKMKKTKSNEILGKMRINDITINVIIPIVLLYAIIFKKEEIKENVLKFYDSLKSNYENEITTVMQTELNLKTNSEKYKQGMIHLHNYYCIKGRCDECDIGKFLYNRDFVNEPLKIIIY